MLVNGCIFIYRIYCNLCRLHQIDNYMVCLFNITAPSRCRLATELHVITAFGGSFSLLRPWPVVPLTQVIAVATSKPYYQNDKYHSSVYCVDILYYMPYGIVLNICSNYLYRYILISFSDITLVTENSPR